MTLFINCCPRGESRTEKLARALLKALGEYEELRLYDEPLHPLVERWCTLFGGDAEALMDGPFTVVTPDSKNPYRQMYAAN